ncbi:uncharacterized protein LOC144669437 [Cetorhinus maximus]
MAIRSLVNMQVLLMVIFLLQVTQSLPPNRHRRHSDSLFTSELSKLRRTVVAQEFLNSILGTQTGLNSNAGKAKRHLSDIEDTTQPGSFTMLQNVLDSLSALQLHEGSEENELSLRDQDVPTMLSKLLRLHSLSQQPCLRWFHSYYGTMRIFSNDSHVPAAASVDHQTCETIRQLIINQQLQTFLTTMGLQ